MAFFFGGYSVRRSTKRLVIELLQDYPNIPNRIKQREEEIKHPVVPRDDNVGGGKAQFKPGSPVENVVLTLNDDYRLKRLKDEYDVITYVYQQASEDTQIIINELYFKRHPAYNMEGLVMNGKISCKATAGYNLRNKFVAEVAKQLKLDAY